MDAGAVALFDGCIADRKGEGLVGGVGVSLQPDVGKADVRIDQSRLAAAFDINLPQSLALGVELAPSPLVSPPTASSLNEVK
jgi:hypothetical protein